MLRKPECPHRNIRPNSQQRERHGLNTVLGVGALLAAPHPSSRSCLCIAPIGLDSCFVQTGSRPRSRGRLSSGSLRRPWTPKSAASNKALLDRLHTLQHRRPGSVPPARLHRPNRILPCILVVMNATVHRTNVVLWRVGRAVAGDARSRRLASNPGVPRSCRSGRPCW